MINFLCTYFVFGLDSITISLLAKRKYGEVFPFAILLQTLLFYIFSIFDDLQIGFYLSLLFPLSGVMSLIYILLKRKDFLREHILTKSFFISLIYFIFIIGYQWNRSYHYVDEFAHWGLMVKESFRLKQFYCVPESAMYYNKDYPPFFTLIELFWCFIASSYKEQLCYMALNFTELSFFLPLLEKYLNQDKIVILVSVILSIILGYSIGYTPSMGYDTFVYNCIYIDWILAYLLGFLFIYIFFSKNSKWDYLFIGIGLSSLVLTKQISIAFYLLIVVYYLVHRIINKEFSINNITLFLLMTAIPLLFSYSWNVVIQSYDVISKFNISDINFLFPLEYFKGTLTEIETTTTTNFMYAILHDGVISWPIKISYLSFMIIIPVLIGVVGIKSNLKNSISTAVIYLCGGIGYAYAMLLSYVYLFGYTEGPTITMFDRYMLIYVLAGFFILFNLYLPKLVSSLKGLIIFSLFVCCFVRPGTVKVSLPQAHSETIYKESVELILKYDSLVSKDEKVLVISQSNPEKRAAIKYALDENMNKYEFLDIAYAGYEKYDEGELYWEDEFRDLLANYDYIYLLDFDESFTDYFWYSNEKPVNDRLYKITYYWTYEIYLDAVYLD